MSSAARILSLAPALLALAALLSPAAADEKPVAIYVGSGPGGG